MRPMIPEPIEVVRLANHPHTTIVKLEGLSEDEIIDLIEMHLRCNELPKQLAIQIRNKVYFSLKIFFL